MKEKYIIGKNSAHDYWGYYNQAYKYPDGSRVINKFLSSPIEATTFDSYEDARDILQYLGVGIFKIVKIFINDNI